MSRPLVIILMTALGTGCSLLGLERPTVACPDPALLTQAECAQAVDAARLVLPAGKQDFTHVDVEARCRPDPRCPNGVATIILTFAGSGGSQTFVRVFRDTWQAETFTPTPPPAPGGPG